MLSSPVRNGIGLMMLVGAAPVASALNCQERIFYDGFEADALSRYEIAVEVSALDTGSPGESVTFALDDGETLTFDTDATACFAGLVLNGDSYTVEVVSQPETGGACVLDGATGTVSGPVTVLATCDSSRSLWDIMIWDQEPWQ